MVLILIALLVVKFKGQISLVLSCVTNSAGLRLVPFYCHSNLTLVKFIPYFTPTRARL